MDKTWNELQDQLKTSLQREVGMLRELLANMHQEEICLLQKDVANCTILLEERSSLISSLSILRVERSHYLKKLSTLAGSQDSNPNLEKLLPPQEVSTCEILSLWDQMIALIEKMNEQNVRNQVLSNQPSIPMEKPLPVPSKPKSGLATYPPEE